MGVVLSWRRRLAISLAWLLAGAAVVAPGPLFKVVPLKDGRYLLEPLTGSEVVSRPPVRSINPNPPAATEGGRRPISQRACVGGGRLR